MRKHVENMFREGMGGKLGSRKWKNTTRRGPRMLPTGTHARTRPYSRSATKRNAEKKIKERRCAIGREKHIFIAGHALLDYVGALLKCGKLK